MNGFIELKMLLSYIEFGFSVRTRVVGKSGSHCVFARLPFAVINVGPYKSVDCDEPQPRLTPQTPQTYVNPTKTSIF